MGRRKKPKASNRKFTENKINTLLKKFALALDEICSDKVLNEIVLNEVEQSLHKALEKQNEEPDIEFNPDFEYESKDDKSRRSEVVKRFVPANKRIREQVEKGVMVFTPDVEKRT